VRRYPDIDRAAPLDYIGRFLLPSGIVHRFSQAQLRDMTGHLRFHQTSNLTSSIASILSQGLCVTTKADD
jgi:hypothetical protein